MNKLKQYIPALQWMSNYKREDLRGDMSAGLTTAVMLVPQAMAYAMLAGLPPLVGLYASVVPLALYALFGSSKELAVGPVAMVSLLVASGVGALSPSGTEEYILLAVTLALMVGVIQLAMGIFKVGFLVNFLSHPVISGFTSAAALIIGFSQLKHLLGVNIPRGKLHETIWSALQQLGAINGTTLLLGAVSVVALVALKRWRPSFPRALAVVVGSTVAVFALDLTSAGVKIVGNVPAGFPSPTLPSMSTSTLSALLPTALTISLVAFMESISVAKAFASRRRYEIEPNQELIGLGLANIAAGLFRGYPVTGGFSRTAVNASAGSRSGLASLITAGVVALTLLFLTPLFHYLPKATLAAIIMTAVFGLVDVKEVKHLWKVKRSDLSLLTLTFVATLAFGIEEGILTGVGASMLWFVVRTTYPHTAVLGRLPNSTVYRNVANYPEAETFPGIAIVRMDAQFYFGNVNFLRNKIKTISAQAETPLRAIVLDASGMNQLDASADVALHELATVYRERGVELVLSNVKQPVYEVMERSHLIELVGPDAFFMDTHEAVLSLLNDAPAPEPEEPSASSPEASENTRKTPSKRAARPMKPSPVH